MPEQPQAEIPQEAVAKFHALTPEQRQTAIGRMTPELKARFLPAAQEYKAMHAPDSAYPQTSPVAPQPTGAGKVVDRVAQFTTRNAPTIAATVGGIGGGMAGGLPGGIAGAAAGGAYGGAIRSKAEGGKVSWKEVGKSAAEQAAWELGGGLAGKGLGKAAKLLGVDEALMKFALKRGEDFSRDLNPAAAMNKYHLHATTTKELYQKAEQKIGSLSRAADAMVDQVSGYSSTVRPYAIVKGVVDKYKAKATQLGDGPIKDAMDRMLDGVGAEFNNVQTGAQGLARDAKIAPKAVEALPTDRLMTTKEANQLKRTWGESVPWGKAPPRSELEAAHKAVTEAKRDIYHALNDSIADAMGGNQGKPWRAANHDIFNLMEARGALQEAGERTAADSKGILPSMLDAMRKPGLASQVGRIVGPEAAANVGNAIPTIGRGVSMGADAMLGRDVQQNPIPIPTQ